MHRRVREHGAPAVDQGVGEGVAQKGWGLAGFGVGELPQESCGFITPTSSNFNKTTRRHRRSRKSSG